MSEPESPTPPGRVWRIVRQLDPSTPQRDYRERAASEESSVAVPVSPDVVIKSNPPPSVFEDTELPTNALEKLDLKNDLSSEEALKELPEDELWKRYTKALQREEKALQRAEQLERQLAEVSRPASTPTTPLTTLDWSPGQLACQLFRHIEHNVQLRSEPFGRRAIFLTHYGIVVTAFAKNLDESNDHTSDRLVQALRANSYQLPFGHETETASLSVIADAAKRLREEMGFHDNAFSRSLLILAATSPNDASSTESPIDLAQRPLDVILTTMASFRFFEELAPEMQFREDFVSNILNAAIYLPGICFPRSEYRMNTIPDFKVNRHADRVFIIDPKFPPVVIIEASGHKVKVDQQHKDFTKLSVEIWASLLYYLGHFEQLDVEFKEQLRVFGVLTGGTQLEYLVMRPHFVRNRKAFSMLLHTHSHWRFDLASPCEDTSTFCADRECSYCRLPNIAARDVQVEDNFEDEELSITDTAMVDPDAGLVEKADATDLRAKDCCLNPMTASQLPAVVSVIRFGEHVKDYAAWLKRELGKKSHPDSSYKITEVMLKNVPESRSGHGVQTPSIKRQSEQNPPGPTATEQPKGNQKNHQLALDKFLDNHPKLVYEETLDLKSEHLLASVKTGGEGLSRRILVKELYPLVVTDDGMPNEVRILKLCASPFVERLFDYETVNDDGDNTADTGLGKYLVMLVEPLVYEIPRESKRAPVFLPFCLKFLLDGMSALEYLGTKGILHRDIAPGNVLWSPTERCWKLIDFEWAIVLPPGVTEYRLGPDEFCPGTKNFIDPKVESERRFTFTSDVFAFVETARRRYVMGMWMSANSWDGLDPYDRISARMRKACTLPCSVSFLPAKEQRKVFLEFVYEAVLLYGDDPSYQPCGYEMKAIAWKEGPVDESVESLVGDSGIIVEAPLSE